MIKNRCKDCDGLVRASKLEGKMFCKVCHEYKTKDKVRTIVSGIYGIL